MLFCFWLVENSLSKTWFPVLNKFTFHWKSLAQNCRDLHQVESCFDQFWPSFPNSFQASFVCATNFFLKLGFTPCKSYPVNTGVPQGSIFDQTLFLLYINDLPDGVICDIAIYADDTSRFSKCDQESDLWQQLGLNL